MKHLSILSSSVDDYPALLLYNLPSMTVSSLILTKLCINENDFDDCLALVDGLLKQLTSVIVQLNHIHQWTSRSYNIKTKENK
ncbi:unnamed protein product [Rotaria magnacalcarata]